jgi:murein DD-endopeptidase MepM/ murein hydrolase activator NlpD
MLKKDFSTYLSICVILFLFVHADFKKREIERLLKAQTPIAVIKIPQKYGIETPNFKLEEKNVQSGMFFNDIFRDFEISSAQIQKLISKAKDVFDVRKLRIGNKFTIFYENLTNKPKYVVYEKNQTDFVVFNLSDSLSVRSGKKEVKTEIKQARGIIESSLWNAMTSSGLNPLLANNLSEVFAWSVDFFGLQTNDQFKVVYEEQFVEGQSIGFGKIITAWFLHNGQEYYAIPFRNDSTEEYFNIDGSNLRKAFLKAPLKFSHIGSKFSNSRFHPILKIFRPHHGVDYSAPAGTPVYALGDGVVTEAGYHGQSGNYVRIKHNSIYETGYLHLRAYGDGVRAGTRVRQGQVIGYVGSTGLSTGPHLDFRVWKNGSPVNPLNIDAPPSKPVKAEKMEDFNKIAQSFKKTLDALK